MSFCIKTLHLTGKSLVANYLNYISEAGFSSYPKGWDRNSILKFAKTLTKETGKSPKDKGFFEDCVKKMEKHMGEGAKGFCASIKDEAYNSTYWRGEDKSKKEAEKDTEEHKGLKKD